MHPSTAMATSGARMRVAVKPTIRPFAVGVMYKARRLQQCYAGADFAPPTVADTKVKFLEAYDKPINPIYNTVIQELLVQQHFMRYNIKFQYDEIQKVLAKIAARVSAGEHFYTRFFAIGLFRLLELTDAKDPKALGGLVKALGVNNDLVNKDLLLYKSILSKMMAAKELMAEIVSRDKRKSAEREAAKEAKESEGTKDSKDSEVPQAI